MEHDQAVDALVNREYHVHMVISQLRSSLRWYRITLSAATIVLLAMFTINNKNYASLGDVIGETYYCNKHQSQDNGNDVTIKKLEIEIASLESDHENKISDLINAFRTRIIQVQNNATRFAASTAGQYLHTLSANSSMIVTAMATLENELLVARYDGNASVIERYDMKTYTFKGVLNIHELVDVVGMDSCSSCECVYIADGVTDTVFRVVYRDGAYRHTSWTVPFQVASLSATSTDGVVVTYNELPEVDEFTANGSLVRTIQLQKDVDRPTQVLELDPDCRLYVVVDWYGDKHSRVCVVEDGGDEPVNCVQYETDNQMAVHVATNGFVYVADFLFGRVELLTSTLSHVRDVISDLSWPYHVWLTSGLLFVAEMDDSQIEDNGVSEAYDRIKVFRIVD